MAQRATHIGHCQVCGSRQKLPGGRLSLHGYTTRWGFFSGTCWGSKHLPWEESCHLVQRAIEGARASRERLIQEAQAEIDSTSPEVWQRVYVGNPGSRAAAARGEAYKLQKVTLQTREVPYTHREGSYTQVFYLDAKGKEHEVSTYGRTLAQLIQEAHQRHAGRLQEEASQLAQYVHWQEARLASWQPQPLELVGA